jgi:glycosyltransferase involved in cell wall biosynthesis
MNMSSVSPAQVTSPMSLNELLDLDDDAFVLAAYRAILGREADHDGFAYYLRRCRNGIDKLHILQQLRFSREGQQHGERVSGLDKAIRVNKVRKFFGLKAAARNRNDTTESRLRVVEGMLHSLLRTSTSTRQQITDLHASLERLRKAPERVAETAPRVEQVETGALVSIITPLYKTSIYYLERLAVSLWGVRDSIEWVIVNDSPGITHLEEFITRMQSCFPHVRCITHETNKGIFAGYTSGVLASTAPYIAILDHDDEVDLGPIVDYLKKAGDRHDLVFTDETRFGQGVTAHFAKPNFDPLSAMHYFYMHHITLFRTSICKSMIEREPDAVTKYRSCFDIWLAFGYVRHFASSPISCQYIPYSSYGWRVHDESTAKDLGQKPVADGERIEIARKLYNRHDSLADIVLDQDARYVVRYVYPVASGSDRRQFASLLCSKFDVFTQQMEQLTESDLSRGDQTLVKALSKVPLAYLSELLEGKCAIVPKKELPRGSDIYARVSNHVEGVPVLETIANDFDPAVLSNLTSHSIGALLPKQTIKGTRIEQSATHLLIV